MPVFEVYLNAAISTFFDFLKYLIIKSIDLFISTKNDFNNIKFSKFCYLITTFLIVKKSLIVKEFRLNKQQFHLRIVSNFSLIVFYSLNKFFYLINIIC